MPAYAIGLLRNVQMNDAIARYLREIDATLEPFGGTFKVHGGTPEMLEGRMDSTLVAIEFPDLGHARRWYASPAYQAILPLRTDHSQGEVFLIEGVRAGYQAQQKLAALGLA
jgi:uncharacterized protein (DUF1330 family)